MVTMKRELSATSCAGYSRLNQRNSLRTLCAVGRRMEVHSPQASGAKRSKYLSGVERQSFDAAWSFNRDTRRNS